MSLRVRELYEKEARPLLSLLRAEDKRQATRQRVIEARMGIDAVDKQRAAIASELKEVKLSWHETRLMLRDEKLRDEDMVKARDEFRRALKAMDRSRHVTSRHRAMLKRRRYIVLQDDDRGCERGFLREMRECAAHGWRFKRADETMQLLDEIAVIERKRPRLTSGIHQPLPIFSFEMYLNIAEYLPSRTRLFGLGSVSKELRKALLSTITRLGVIVGAPGGFLNTLTALEHVKIVGLGPAKLEQDYLRYAAGWVLKSVVDFKNGGDVGLQKRLTGLEVDGRLLDPFDLPDLPELDSEYFSIADILLAVEWSKLRTMRVPVAGPLLAIQRRPHALPALEVLGVECPWDVRSLRGLRAIQGDLGTLRRLEGAAAGEPCVVELDGSEEGGEQDLRILGMARETDAVTFRLVGYNLREVVNAVKALLEQDRLPELRKVGFAARQSITEELVQHISVLPLASRITQLRVEILSQTYYGEEFQVAGGAFPQLEALEVVMLEPTEKTLRPLLAACGPRLRSLRMSCDHGWCCNFKPNLSLLTLQSVIQAGGAPWAESLEVLGLPTPFDDRTTEVELAQSLKYVLCAMPRLRHLIVSRGRDGAVLGVLEAKEAGALQQLKRWELRGMTVTGGDEYEVKHREFLKSGRHPEGWFGRPRNGAGLLLLAWLCTERDGLARGLRVKQAYSKAMSGTVEDLDLPSTVHIDLDFKPDWE